ncbi:MraY family glycosyltransferase [Pikeienuella sp. HZG-20]|uniref:MraY family glycosyltransferase n=1 Tax=Paludibacillus litoralis TaxID=3133267 RepID=UPI0030ECD3B2
MNIQLTILLNVFLVTVVAIQLLRPLAPRFGLLDAPGAIKLHDVTTPSCGGLAIAAALAVAAALGSIASPPVACAWVAAIAALGALDDRRALSPRVRLGAQFAAAAALMLSTRYALPNLGEFSTNAGWAVLASGAAISLLFTVGVVNSFNLIDGVDGLAGAVTLAGLFWLVEIARVTGDAGVASDAEVAMAATAGFLVFNLRHPWRARAAVFLGDAGSTALGATFACLILALASRPGGAHLPALIWLVAAPLIDMGSLVVRRIAAHRSPFAGDRRHLHHLLLDFGLSPALTTALIAAASCVCGAVGYLGVLYGASAAAMIAALGAPIAAHCLVVRAARPETRARLSARLAQIGAARLHGANPASRDEGALTPQRNRP